MAKALLVDESVLIELAAKFERAHTLFDVIEDEVHKTDRTYHLATIGLHLTFDAVHEIETLLQDAEGRHHG